MIFGGFVSRMVIRLWESRTFSPLL